MEGVIAAAAAAVVAVVVGTHAFAYSQCPERKNAIERVEEGGSANLSKKRLRRLMAAVVSRVEVE